MDTLLRDLRFSLRLLVKTPSFTAAAIAVLALGIGANTAIFSVVRELVFSPRPFPDAAQVVQLYTQDKKDPQRFRQFSYPTYRDVCEQNTAFNGILAHNLTIVGVGEGENTRRTFAAIVSSNYFSTLGVPLAQGRAFLPAEEKPGSAAPVVIASHLYWKKTGGDPQLVGKTIRVNERPFTVVGITPEHFTGTMMLFGPELYFPLGDFDLLTSDFQTEAKRTLERRDAYNLFVVGRLKAGVTAATAEAALNTLATNLEKALPVEQQDQTFTLRPLPRLSTSSSPSTEGGDLKLLGAMLLGMAGIVLLIACLNLANMLLARGAAQGDRHPPRPGRRPRPHHPAAPDRGFHAVPRGRRRRLPDRPLVLRSTGGLARRPHAGGDVLPRRRRSRRVCGHPRFLRPRHAVLRPRPRTQAHPR